MNEYVKKSIEKITAYTLSDEERNNMELVISFQNEILNKYNSYFANAMNSEFINGIEMSIILEDCGLWKEMSTENKIARFVSDNYLEQLKSVSASIFDIAINKLERQQVNISHGDLENLKKIVNDSFGLVRKENKAQAEEIASETYLDLNYIANNADAMSMRLFHYKNQLEGEKGNNK